MAHTDFAGDLSPSRVMEKSPMPVTPPAGYLPERPCTTIPDSVDSPPASPPKDSYSRQNPFGISQQQQQSPEDEEMNTRGGGRGKGGGLCEVLLAACCCYAMCEICC